MIYFYYGEDSFRARETVMQLKKKFIELYDKAGHNTETIDVSDFSLEHFFTSVKAQGFLSNKKFIIIKNLFSHKKFADVQDPIIAFLKTQKNTKDENYLIFWQEGNPRQNLKLFKYLRDLCTPVNCCKEFGPLEPRQRIAWLQAQAKTLEKSLDREAAEIFASLVGEDSWTLYHELHKLCHFVSGSSITVESVRELIHATQIDVMFDFLDALSAKQKNKALALLEQYLTSDTDRQKLFGMILRQFRLIVQVREASVTLSNSYAIAERLKLHPFVAKKMLAHSKNFTKKELQAIYTRLVQLDMVLKNDPPTFNAALAMFIMKL